MDRGQPSNCSETLPSGLPCCELASPYPGILILKFCLCLLSLFIRNCLFLTCSLVPPLLLIAALAYLRFASLSSCWPTWEAARASLSGRPAPLWVSTCKSETIAVAANFSADNISKKGPYCKRGSNEFVSFSSRASRMSFSSFLMTGSKSICHCHINAFRGRDCKDELTPNFCTSICSSRHLCIAASTASSSSRSSLAYAVSLDNPSASIILPKGFASENADRVFFRVFRPRPFCLTERTSARSSDADS